MVGEGEILCTCFWEEDWEGGVLWSSCWARICEGGGG
jgi:hypothetical protein